MDNKLRIIQEMKDKDFPNYEYRKCLIFWEYMAWDGEFVKL